MTANSSIVGPAENILTSFDDLLRVCPHSESAFDLPRITSLRSLGRSNIVSMEFQLVMVAYMPGSVEPNATKHLRDQLS